MNTKPKNKKPQKRQGDLFYIIPMILYIFVPLFMTQIGFHSEVGYVIRTALVGFLLILFFRKYKEINYTFSKLAVIVGISVFVIWVIAVLFTYDTAQESTFPEQHRLLLYGVHFIGAILVAPLIEELFVRSYLMRLIISNDWRSVAIGKATMPSFLITVLFFGLAHNQIIAGIIVGILLNFLLYYTQNITDCIIAHSVANALLFIYVILTQSFFLW